MNEIFQQELREQFIQKLIDDYEDLFSRQGESGTDLSTIQNVNGFVEDVCDLVEAALAKQVGTVEARRLTPSKDTFRRFLFEYKPENRWQSRTRLALCLFLGYSSWEAFKESNREQLQDEFITLNSNQLMVRPAWLPTQQVQYIFLTPPATAESSLLRRFSVKKVFGMLIGLLAVIGLGQWGWQW